MAKKSQKKDLEYKVDMIFNYTRHMHRYLFTMLSMVGVIFALLIFNTYAIYETMLTGNLALESDFGIFPPFVLVILILVFAIIILAKATSKKGKFEEIILKI